MIKLIACDLDGTLLPRGEKRLAAKLEKRIKTFLSNGKHFAVISGRDYLSLRSVLDFSDDKIYYFCCGGSVCIRNGKVFYSRPIGVAGVLAAMKYADMEQRNAVLCSDTSVFVYGSRSFFGDVKKYYSESPDVIHVKSSREVNKPVYKISFAGDGKEIFDAGEMNALSLQLFYNRNGWQEYVSRISGKAHALSELRARLGVLISETVAAGDDMCDIDMLKKAGKAYATDIKIAELSGAKYVAIQENILDFD